MKALHLKPETLERIWEMEGRRGVRCWRVVNLWPAVGVRIIEPAVALEPAVQVWRRIMTRSAV